MLNPKTKRRDGRPAEPVTSVKMTTMGGMGCCAGRRCGRTSMSSNQRSVTAEDLYNAMLSALRDGGDAKLCRALDMLAGDTRQNKYKNAASVIGGTVLCRHAIDAAASRDRAIKRRGFGL
jgi:hypothetical protein